MPSSRTSLDADAIVKPRNTICDVVALSSTLTCFSLKNCSKSHENTLDITTEAKKSKNFSLFERGIVFCFFFFWIIFRWGCWALSASISWTPFVRSGDNLKKKIALMASYNGNLICSKNQVIQGSQVSMINFLE